jgi:hypothetical protein
VRPLHHAPAVVPSRLDDVDFLVEVLADVADEEEAVDRVEAHAIRVAHAVGVNLPPHLGVGIVDEGIVRRDRVVQADIRRRANVDAQDLADEERAVLPLEIRIALASAVALRDVKHAVGAEGDRSPLVIGAAVIDGQDDLLAAGVGRVARGIVEVEGVSAEMRDLSFGAVMDIELAEVRRSGIAEIGIERQAEQALFVAARIAQKVVDIQKQRHVGRGHGVGGILDVGKDVNQPVAADVEEAMRSVHRVHEKDRFAEIEIGEDANQFHITGLIVGQLRNDDLRIGRAAVQAEGLGLGLRPSRRRQSERKRDGRAKAPARFSGAKVDPHQHGAVPLHNRIDDVRGPTAGRLVVATRRNPHFRLRALSARRRRSASACIRSRRLLNRRPRRRLDPTVHRGNARRLHAPKASLSPGFP